MKTDGIWNTKWMAQMGISLAAPLLILLVRPIGLTLRQSAVVAAVLLAIIWWSTGLVKKIPTSIFLTVCFLLFSGAGLEKVFAFPLSETFPMIVITYLFSQAIANSGLIEKLFQPLLLRFVHTPLQCLLAVVAMMYATMYVIPQPLARVIIVATVFDRFLKKTTLPKGTKSVLLYAVFHMAAAINMSARDADMIMNRVAAGFSDVPITNGMWMRYMFVPTLVCVALVLALLIGVFRKDLFGQRVELKEQGEEKPYTRSQKLALIIIAATVVLWMTNGIHGINNTIITIAATVLLFAVGVLHKEDWKAVDVTTLIFLTAAFAIGGVMKECGAADKVFGLMKGLFPENFSVLYLWMMVLITMLLHMMLGSNTTTLSVVVPGMMILCGGVVSSPVVVFTAIITVSYHMLLPFHSVGVMIGASNGYFPNSYVTKLGIPTTLLVYLAAACIYLPYWRLTGLL